MYKMFEAGSLSWPRTTQEAAELTEEQFNYLMLGLNPLDPKIKEIYPEHAQYLLCKIREFLSCFYQRELLINWLYLGEDGWVLSTESNV